MRPPPLKNDCFALPPGVHWTPVDEAHALLKQRLSPVTGIETLPLMQAAGRFLAADATALRANPPLPNSAVDGYGFAGGVADEGVTILPLAPGRAAAGAPFAGQVPAGHAIRILTGAVLPDGVDTVVLEEDVSAEPTRVAFRGPVRAGANTRPAGEDAAEGAPLLPAGAFLRPADLAVLAATGLHEVRVRAPLRVGILSTGDEIRPVGAAAERHQIWDANRPMLLALAASWGFEAVDLGHVGDDRAALRDRLDAAAGEADAIVTTGGASAGDEDHVSALLGETGSRALWRLAVKPGRPMLLGLWSGVPVFGLPGNPVAAFVCALIFAEPAFRVLAGGDWRLVRGVTVPAAFEKRKKPGRREYLRARLNAEGAAEIYPSEGSGLVLGLSWADGLIEIGDGAARIAPGDPVRYLPFTAFGGK